MKNKEDIQEMFTKQLINDLMKREDFKKLGEDIDIDDKDQFRKLFTQSRNNGTSQISVRFKLKSRIRSTEFIYLWLLKEFVKELNENGIQRAKKIINENELKEVDSTDKYLNKKAQVLVNKTILYFFAKKMDMNFICSVKMDNFDNYKGFIINLEKLLDNNLEEILKLSKEDGLGRNEALLFYVGVKIVSTRIEKLEKQFETTDQLCEVMLNAKNMDQELLIKGIKKEITSGFNVNKVFYSLIGDEVKDKEKIKKCLNIRGQILLKSESAFIGGTMNAVGEGVGVSEMINLFFFEVIKYKNIMGVSDVIGQENILNSNISGENNKKFNLNTLNKIDLIMFLRDILELKDIRQYKNLRDGIDLVISRRNEEKGTISYVLAMTYGEIEGLLLNMNKGVVGKQWNIIETSSSISTIKRTMDYLLKNFLYSSFDNVKEVGVREYSIIYEFENKSLVDIRDVFRETFNKIEEDIISNEKKEDHGKYVNELLDYMKNKKRELILENSLTKIAPSNSKSQTQKKKI